MDKTAKNQGIAACAILFPPGLRAVVLVAVLIYYGEMSSYLIVSYLISSYIFGPPNRVQNNSLAFHHPVQATEVNYQVLGAN